MVSPSEKSIEQCISQMSFMIDAIDRIHSIIITLSDDDIGKSYPLMRIKAIIRDYYKEVR